MAGPLCNWIAGSAPAVRDPRHRGWVVARGLSALMAAAVAATTSPGHTAAAKPGAGHAASTAHSIFLPAVTASTAAPSVVFAPPHGIYRKPFALVLHGTLAGATIRYTLDGGEPSPYRGYTYSAPLPIEHTTVIRAALFVNDERVSPLGTRTYVFPGDVLQLSDEAAIAAGFPATWGTYTDRRWAGDPVGARYALDAGSVAVDGAAIEAALAEVPTLSVVTSIDDLFGPSGLYANPLDEALEVPVSVEMLRAPEEDGFQADCGLRIAGNWSRRPEVMLKHSFSLRFRSKYGSSRLQYALFPGSPVASFDTLRLRGGQADSFPYFANKAQVLHDQWARDTQRDMGWISARGRFVHLYLDGLYWGLYNLTEEPTAAFASDHLGDREGAWDVVKDSRVQGAPGPPEAEDGSLDAYRSMQDIVEWRPEPDPAAPEDRELYARLAALLDLDQHIDYVLLQIYGANVDWPLTNYRAMRDRELPDRFQFLLWDYEHTTALRDDPSRGYCQTRVDPDTGECGYIADTGGVGGLHGWLAHYPDYRLAFADRAHLHLMGDGALAPTATGARYAALAGEVEGTIAAETARWGTGRPQPQAKEDQTAVWNEYNAKMGWGPQTAGMWRAERDRLLGEFFPARTSVALGQLCRRDLYPPVNAPAIVVAGAAGAGAVALRVSDQGCPGGLSEGAIYYTLDGSDPREAWTGDTAPTAALYTRPIAARGYVRVRARTLADMGAGRQWSALAEVVLGKPRIRVSEIMYHPSDGAGPEFVEVENLEWAAVRTSSLSITGAVTGSLRAAGEIPARGFALVSGDLAAFHQVHPQVPLAGAFAGRLDNAGEQLRLLNGDAGTATTIPYDDEAFWPRGADGLGFSLVPSAIDRGPSRPESWRASTERGGSPGREDPDLPAGHGLVIPSEVLASPADHQEDAIELGNTSGVAVDIGGWYLSDDLADLAKFRVPPGTVVSGGGFVTLYRSAFGADPDRGFGLAADGEEVFLCATDPHGDPTGAIASLAFGPSEPGVPWGRHATAWGPEAVPLVRATFGVDEPESVEAFRSGQGGTNAPPLVGPVVVNEVHAAPADTRGAFVELMNAGSESVALGGADPSGPAWALGGSVALEFPRGASIAPGEHVLLVGMDPHAWPRPPDLPPTTQVIGPYAGTLYSDGGTLTLTRPAMGQDTGGSPVRITADIVRFGAGPPWHAAALRSGRSLERIRALDYGGDPTNWAAPALGGTPGRANTPLYTVRLPLASKGW